MPARPVFAAAWRWVAALGCVTLAACAVPEWQKPGTLAPQIARDMGKPDLRVLLPDGGERWLYSRQPAGQQVYHLVFNAQQQLLRTEQVLQEAHFSVLTVGKARQQDVLEYFGKPALVEGVGNFKGDIWTYRIRENGIDRQAHVFIDPQGVVQRVMFTDEPRNEPNDRQH